MQALPLVAMFAGATLVGPVLSQAATDPDPGQARSWQVGNATVRTWTEGGIARAAVSRDGARTWQQLAPPESTLELTHGAFDPGRGTPTIAPSLTATSHNRLFVVQFSSPILGEYRDALRARGAEIHSYLPFQAYLVRMDRAPAEALRALPWVRFVDDFHPAYRLPHDLAADLLTGADLGTAQYDVLTVHQHDDAATLEHAITALGGRVDQPAGGSGLVTATLDDRQLRRLIHHDTLMWIERKGAIGFDMDNARIQGGADWVENLTGINGKGMRAHVFEPIEGWHPEFGALPPFRVAAIQVRSIQSGVSTQHGTNTAGEVFARGLDWRARGVMPFAQGLFTDSSHPRYQLYLDLTDPNLPYRALSTTASWGNPQTTAYTANSVLMDVSIFDSGLFATNSQSNTGNQRSRPEAWAKNSCGVGGFLHRDNTDPSDDCWCGTGSTGPAADGRIGVTLAGYYESIYTTDFNGGYTPSFGGTSGATPMINGFAGIATQMFTEGLFGYPGVSWQARFLAKPKFTTTKAMLIATAAPLPFNQSTRYQQGWGFPDVKKLYDNRDQTLVVDEEDVLQQGQSKSYYVWVKPGTPELRVAMTYADPAGTANSTVHRVNSLDLYVDDPAGTRYWGNSGLVTSHWSDTSQGANDRDTEECVFLQTPVSGAHVVTVTAPAVRQDAHLETSEVDADFALVVHGIGGGRDTSGMLLDLISTKPGELVVSLDNATAGHATGMTLLSLSTTRHRSLGNLFGLEFDGLSASTLAFAAAAGNVFHFTSSTNPAVYPNADFAFPAGLATALQGITLDAVAVVFDQAGQLLDVSNVDRVTVR